MNRNLFLAIVVACLLWPAVAAVGQNRWKIAAPCEIEWTPQEPPHEDHVEMSGKRVSVVYRYGIGNDGGFRLDKGMVWPLLRTVPNNTHASLMRRFGIDPVRLLNIDGLAVGRETVTSIRLNGTLEVSSTFDCGRGQKIKLLRQYFPSVEQPAAIERYAIVNIGERRLRVEVPRVDISYRTAPDEGTDGAYLLEYGLAPSGCFYLNPRDTLRLSAYMAGRKPGETLDSIRADREAEQRALLLDQLASNLILETPDSVINTMFAFSKIRACESIYETAGGPMHGPGGESFYAAIWANDQAEYINPYFPFTGYEYGCRSALNSFAHFARFMNNEWKPIPSSIIAEGKDIWNGAGDRGDAAMIAYGAARYALARGSRPEAEQLWPLITWCLEYCRRKMLPEGVIASDSDELEGRFPSGKANLCTSSLYYDALLSASCLAHELGKGDRVARQYRSQAKKIRKDIEAYFGANVEGFDTYAYYQGNDVLRSWICIPLTVGITERAPETIRALFSPRLWTENGLLTQAGDDTFWDRATLYALRGVYTAGEVDKATAFLHRYSSTRLLGEHVPYAIEAWPEGNQRHLSAESGLYGRVITEGLFGIRPTGFRSFTMTPRLPSQWGYMTLRRVCAFGSTFDIQITKAGEDKMRVLIKKAGKTVTEQVIRKGKALNVRL